MPPGHDIDLGVQKPAKLITREDIVDNNGRPLTVLTQSQLIDALSTELLCNHYWLQQLRALSHDRQRAHEPSNTHTHECFTALSMFTYCATACSAMHSIASAFLSVKCVICDKMKETCAHIFIPHKRSFILVLWREEGLVGKTHSTWNFGSNWPCLSENAHFQSIFAHSTSAVTPSKKVQLTLTLSPLHAFQWAQDEIVCCH